MLCPTEEVQFLKGINGHSWAASAFDKGKKPTIRLFRRVWMLFGLRLRHELWCPETRWYQMTKGEPMDAWCRNFYPSSSCILFLYRSRVKSVKNSTDGDFEAKVSKSFCSLTQRETRNLVSNFREGYKLSCREMTGLHQEIDFPEKRDFDTLGILPEVIFSSSAQTKSCLCE